MKQKLLIEEQLHSNSYADEGEIAQLLKHSVVVISSILMVAFVLLFP